MAVTDDFNRADNASLGAGGAMTQFSSLWGRLLTQELGTDDSTQLFTDARRKAAINDGIREFADLTECFVRTSTLVWPVGPRNAI
jgi:hypothetical protein